VREASDDTVPAARWYDAPAPSNFISVRSEEELRDVMRAAYGNARASTLLVVEFYAKWCASCRRLYPRLTKLAAQEQDVLFVKIEFDECKELCRKLGVVKLPYFHVYNGSGSRLADFASSLEPTKFKRLTDAIEENRATRCALPHNVVDPDDAAHDVEYLRSLVKLHHVTFAWRGGGRDVMIAGDVAGGWTHTLSLTRRSKSDVFGDLYDGGSADGSIEDDDDEFVHAVTCLLPTGTFRFKFIVDGEWTCEPNYPIVADAQENVNNEIFVGPASWPFEWVAVPTKAPSGPPAPLRPTPIALLDMHEPSARNAANAGVEVSTKKFQRRKLPGGDDDAVKALYGQSAKKSDNVKDGWKPEDYPKYAHHDDAPPQPPKSPPEEKKEEKIEEEDTSFPRKVKVSSDDFMTKREHDAKVAEDILNSGTAGPSETAAAFARLKFTRDEKAAQEKTLAKGGERAVRPSDGELKEARSLKSVEERLARIERLLEERGEMGLNEG
jgi:thiol-disulfide isomerase/thioredoxin